MLEHLQLDGLDLSHEELHALLAVLVEQALGVLIHGGAALAAQGTQDDAESLRAARLHNLFPIKQ